MFIIKKLIFDDIDYVQNLCDSLFGSYLNIYDYFDDCLVLKNNNEIIGFAIVQDLDAIQIKLITHNYVNKSAIYLKVLGIKTSRQKQNFGSIFLKYLFENNLKSIICTAWKINNHIPAKSLLEKNNFELITEINNYWLNDSLNKVDYCINCGSPCYCSCFIYIHK